MVVVLLQQLHQNWVVAGAEQEPVGHLDHPGCSSGLEAPDLAAVAVTDSLAAAWVPDRTDSLPAAGAEVLVDHRSPDLASSAPEVPVDAPAGASAAGWRTQHCWRSRSSVDDHDPPCTFHRSGAAAVALAVAAAAPAVSGIGAQLDWD